jgi:hypothetical protein
MDVSALSASIWRDANASELLAWPLGLDVREQRPGRQLMAVDGLTRANR